MRLLRHLLSPVVTEQREGTQLDALPYVCVYVRSRGGNSLDRDVTLNSVMQLDANRGGGVDPWASAQTDEPPF